MAGKPPKQPKAPKRPRLRKVVDNDAAKGLPLPTPHNRKANCIAELGSVQDYVRRLLEEVEANEAVPQGMCGVNLVRKAGGYNRVAQKVSWDRGVVRNANSAPLTSDEWMELATPRLWPRNDKLLPTDEELLLIMRELQVTLLPHVVDFTLTNKGVFYPDADMPKILQLAPYHQRWVVCRREKGDWIGKMVIVRLDPKEKEDRGWMEEYLFGERSPPGDDEEQQQADQQDDWLATKRYLPFVKLDDGRWINGEPDAPLPLWGLEEVTRGAFVMVHEGPRKAAMASAAGSDPHHPWHDTLQIYKHVAWVSGAHRVDEVDWQELVDKRPAEVVICADNDDAGRAAVPLISKALNRLQVFLLQFDDQWPQGFDLADPFPEKLFKTYDGKRRYVGPQPEELLVPTTWATRDTGKKTRNGNAIFELRLEFANRWRYVEDQESFVHLDNIVRLFKPEHLNWALAPFAHQGANVARLLSQSFRGRVQTLTYAPDQPKGVILVEGRGHAINQFRPSLIRAREGDVIPFKKFLKHLVPDEKERYQVKRWFATAIAHPERMMKFGLLLFSKTFGVGKNTLTDAVLAPLLGVHNCSWPIESMILNSEFNAWIVNKRLVVVSEIYSGHGMRMYNRLKTYITDKDIEARLMYMDPYYVQNWAQFVLCTNYEKALILAEEKERRWLVPRVTEQKLHWDKAAEFRLWLRTGGLESIMAWAHNWQDYVREGEEAPLTVGKRELFEAQRSEHMKEAVELAMSLADLPAPKAMNCRAIWEYLVKNFGTNTIDDMTKMRAAMAAACKGGRWTTKDERVTVGDRKDYVLMNAALLAEIEQHEKGTWAEEIEKDRNIARNKLIRERVAQPTDLDPM